MALHLRKLRTGGVTVDNDLPAVHHFAPKTVQAGLVEGWLSIGDGRIVVRTTKGDVAYRIAHGPGRAVCCKCGDTLDMEGQATSAGLVERRLAHVGACDGKGEDPNNPAGYRVDLYWDCELEEDNRG